MGQSRLEDLDSLPWSGVASLQHSVIRRDVRNVPQETLQSSMHSTHNKKEVEEGTQKHGLKFDLQLWGVSPAKVIDVDITEKRPNEEHKFK